METTHQKDLKTLTVGELREKAKALGLSNYQLLKKEDLAKVVEKAEAAKRNARSSDAKNQKDGGDDKEDASAEVSELSVLSEESLVEEKKEKIILEEARVGFIDRGAFIPDFVPGTRLRALVRDPETVYVYWDCEFDNAEGWKITALDENFNELASFVNVFSRGSGGYLHLDTSKVKRIRLQPIRNGHAQETTLESIVTLSGQFSTDNAEKWVDVQSGAVVSEAPAPGRAPGVEEYAKQMAERTLRVSGLGQSSWVHHPSVTGDSDFPPSSLTLIK